MVLMFKKEVAERIVARPSTKPYGRLSVLAQWRTEARIVLGLPPEAFTPPPKISSAVVDFLPISAPAEGCRGETVGRVTGAAFGQRRKMLRQSLRSLVAEPALLLARAGISPEARGETLSPAEFARLARLVEEAGL